MTIDRLDAEILELFAAEPRIGVLEAARRIGAARNTIQARLDRMQRNGVIASLAPTVDLQRVIDDVVRDPAVVRASTSIALDTPVRHRTGPLVRSVAGRPAG